MEIRLETPQDFAAVENLTREAFWNVYAPGCDEHYLVHILRKSPDFIPGLSFVACEGGRLIGHIAYSRSAVEDASGHRHETATFGPVSVLPEHQGKGVGSALIRHSLQCAAELGFRAVIIEGDPAYYHRFGFVGTRQYGICRQDGRFPAPQMGLELYPGSLQGISGRLFFSPVYNIDPQAAAAFDRPFPPKEKDFAPSQLRFQELTRAFDD